MQTLQVAMPSRDNGACASLVQLVERRSPKPDVGGSSPPGRGFLDFRICNFYGFDRRDFSKIRTDHRESGQFLDGSEKRIQENHLAHAHADYRANHRGRGRRHADDPLALGPR